jgi:hypothetical protein
MLSPSSGLKIEGDSTFLRNVGTDQHVHTALLSGDKHQRLESPENLKSQQLTSVYTRDVGTAVSYSNTDVLLASYSK